jgi:hypothetical protein
MMNKLIFMFMIFALTVSLSAQTETKNPLIFKIIKSQWNEKNRWVTTFYFYQSGRIDCQLEQTNAQNRRLIKDNKSKCNQIVQTWMKELIGFAEQADFQSAKKRYLYFRGIVYDRGSLTIVHFRQRGQKRIELNWFPPRGTQEQIPKALEIFLQNIGAIDERMSVVNSSIRID